MDALQHDPSAPLPAAGLSTYAHVVAGTVVEVLSLPAGIDHAVVMIDPASSLAPCGAEVAQGWTTADGGATFAPPPLRPPVAGLRRASTYLLMSALTDAQGAAYGSAVKAWDQRRFSARDTPWPEDNVKLARIATALGTTPSAWFDAALATPAA